MVLAERALEPATRHRLLDRQRTPARAGRRTLLHWVAAHPDLVALDPRRRRRSGCPGCCAGRTRWPSRPPSGERTGVLVCPGVYLGAEGHLRLSHALDPARTAEALDRIAEVLGAA
jgi:hypothetical protein